MADYIDKAKANGVADLRWLSAQEVAELEPLVHSVGGVLSPSTGIVDFLFGGNHTNVPNPTTVVVVVSVVVLLLRLCRPKRPHLWLPSVRLAVSNIPLRFR